jgi:hypothetical protein
MITRFFLALSVSILPNFCASAASLTEIEQKQIALPDSTLMLHHNKTIHIPDDQLVTTAETVTQETLAILATLQPTNIITPLILHKNRQVALARLERIRLSSELNTAFIKETNANNGVALSPEAEDKAILGIATNIYTTINTTLLSQKTVTPQNKNDQKMMLLYYKRLLQEIIHVWSPKNHIHLMRQHTQRLLTMNSIATIAATSMKPKETA